jgi:hypothetical protein
VECFLEKEKNVNECSDVPQVEQANLLRAAAAFLAAALPGRLPIVTSFRLFNYFG